MASEDTTGFDPRRVEDAVLHSEIRRLLEGYADVVNRRDWAGLDALFVPAAAVRLDLRHQVYEFTGPAEVAAFVGPAVERFEFFQFVILGMTIQVRAGGDPDAATGRTDMSELRQDGLTHQWSQIHGVYHDRFSRVDGTWRFAERRYHSMARRSAGETSAEVFAFPEHLRLGVPRPGVGDGAGRP